MTLKIRLPLKVGLIFLFKVSFTCKSTISRDQRLPRQLTLANNIILNSKESCRNMSYMLTSPLPNVSFVGKNKKQVICRNIADFPFRLYIRGRSVWLGMLSSAVCVWPGALHKGSVSSSNCKRNQHCQFLQNIFKIKFALAATKQKFTGQDLEMMLHMTQSLPNYAKLFSYILKENQPLS